MTDITERETSRNSDHKNFRQAARVGIGIEPIADRWTEALRLARRGLPIFPCVNQPGQDTDKRPLTPNGFKDASTDPDLVHEWWTAHPNALIGVPTGIKFVVVDLDLEHEEAQAWLADNRDRVPLTRTHRTRSGGIHWLFAPNDKIKCSVSRLGPHIDTRGHGGYIIWWPACRLEVWHGTVFAHVPDWICNALAPPPPPVSRCFTARGRGPSSALLRAQLRVLADAREGQRNQALFWAACRMGEAVRAGAISEDEAVVLLTSVGRQVGLLDREIVRTARSGIREGIKR